MTHPARTIEDASVADLPAILAIYNDVIATSTAVFSEDAVTLQNREEWMQARHAAGYPVLVSREASGAVAGFASFGDFRTWPGYRFTVEHSIHVRADLRGTGVGAPLLAALEARARDCGKAAMVAGIDAENTASIRLHARAGFLHAGTLPGVAYKFGRWLDLTFMVKSLIPPAT